MPRATPMESFAGRYEEDSAPSPIPGQAAWLFTHAALAIGTWLAIMIMGYFFNPPEVSQWAVLSVSVAVPMAVGMAYARVQQDEMAEQVWLLGMIWLLGLSLWILDLPTGPNACFQCDATEKLARTFFNVPRPSGLIDNDGPFIGTWPAAALIGYSIGARLASRRKRQTIERRE